MTSIKKKNPGEEILNQAWDRAVNERRDRLYQHYIAEKMGINRQYLSAIERGERGRTFENLVSYAHAVGVDPLALLGAGSSATQGNPHSIPVSAEVAEEFRNLRPSTQEVVVGTITLTVRNQKRLEEETAKPFRKVVSAA